MANLYMEEREFDVANAHAERAKSYAVNNARKLGRAMELQARIWFQQHKFEEAKLEALHALEICEKLGAARDVGDCKRLLRKVEQATESENRSPGPQGELLEITIYPLSVNSTPQDEVNPPASWGYRSRH